MLRLLGRQTSGNVQKVIWLLEELGLDYRREDYGRQFGNTRTDDYLKLNPNAKVPTLVDDGLAIWESNTILRYVGNKTGCDLYPDEPKLRSLVERWMDWQLASLNQPYLQSFREAKKDAAERAASFEADARALGEQLEILDAALRDAHWLAAERMTLAEVCLGPVVKRCLGFPIDLPPLAALRRWYDGFAGRAAFEKATAG